jgi:hypothetical protein
MSKSRKYKILTTDEQLLGYAPTRKEAEAFARQQARRLRESIEIKRRNADGEYEQIAMVKGGASGGK